MSHYKPYPAYKDSGVEWIGEVPEYWSVVRIKRAAQIATDRCNIIPAGLPYIGLEDVESGSGQYKPTATASRQSDDSTVGLFQEGDVLYGKLRPYLRKCIAGRVDGACSTEFLILKPSLVSTNWLQNWLLTPDVTQQIEAGCDGAKMPRTDWEHVGSIHIPTPNKTEQDFILAALDRETARIDTLITRKIRFIELLKEKRSALITHAVTKGLDPTVKMKDSGVEWIGEVPEHWQHSKVAWDMKMTIGWTPPTGNRSYYGGPHNWVSIADLSAGRVCNTKQTITDKAVAEMRGTRAPAGSLLFSYKLSLGEVALLEQPAYTNEAIAAFHPCKRVHMPFWKYAAPVILPRYSRENIYGSALLNQELMNSARMYLPEVVEQEAIAAAIDRETTRIDALIAKTQHSIDLLKERRAAFITAAVTGQIDLRGEIA